MNNNGGIYYPKLILLCLLCLLGKGSSVYTWRVRERDTRGTMWGESAVPYPCSTVGSLGELLKTIGAYAAPQID